MCGYIMYTYLGIQTELLWRQTLVLVHVSVDGDGKFPNEFSIFTMQ